MFFYTKQNKKQKQERGFTLVETLISILLLLIVVVGPMSIAARGLQSSYFANEQMTAVFLAQEAVEWIHQMRDDNALEVVEKTEADTWSWLDDVLDPSCIDVGGSDNGCDVDFENGGAVSCATPSNCRLHINPASTGRLYGYGNDWIEESIYTRIIKVREEGSGAVSVEVTVSWGTNLLSSGGRVTLQTWIYDQYNSI